MVPRCASALKPEDPRHAMSMAHPPHKPDCREELRTVVYQSPKVGDVLLWEGLIRHEVPLNMAEEERILVSFNYRAERKPNLPTNDKRSLLCPRPSLRG